MDRVKAIAESWGWSGLQPKAVIAENAFGSLIVEDQGGTFWRITPEELSCEVVARSRPELDALLRDPAFLSDWNMQTIVNVASASVGPLAAGRKYCLKLPAVLGGDFDATNLGSISELELIRATGDMARQIADLPDGANVRLEITE